MHNLETLDCRSLDAGGLFRDSEKEQKRQRALCARDSLCKLYQKIRACCEERARQDIGRAVAVSLDGRQLFDLPYVYVWAGTNECLEFVKVQGSKFRPKERKILLDGVVNVSPGVVGAGTSEDGIRQIQRLLVPPQGYKRMTEGILFFVRIDTLPNDTREALRSELASLTD